MPAGPDSAQGRGGGCSATDPCSCVCWGHRDLQVYGQRQEDTERYYCPNDRSRPEHASRLYQYLRNYSS